MDYTPELVQNQAQIGIITAVAAVSLGFLFWKLRAKYQIVQVKKEGPDETGVMRPAHHPELMTSMPGVNTMHESFMKAAKEYKDRRCLGTRPTQPDGTLGGYRWQTFGEVAERVKNFGSAMASTFKLKPGSRVGIFSKNREEWVIAQQACFRQNLVIVSFYETLGKDALRFVADHSEIELVICDKGSLRKMTEVAVGLKNRVKNIVIMDDAFLVDKDDLAVASKAGLKVYFFHEMETEGHLERQPEVSPKRDDMCTIMYTSGTTGNPKGVIITHGNIVSSVASIDPIIKPQDDDVYLSYLPFAHILERVVVGALLNYGCAVGFFSGDVRQLSADLKFLKPTLFACVPRVAERIKEGVFTNVAKKGLIVRALFNSAFWIRTKALLWGVPLPVLSTVMDTVVFAKVKQETGGRIRALLSGGAPLSLQTEAFLRACISPHVSQGYGLTETCGTTAVKLLDDPAIGSIGPPLACNEIKLVDVPDMKYFSSDHPCPRGEVYIRGGNVAQGYYKDRDKTKEDFIEGGWFKSGDIGQWNRNGTLSIIDRKKNMFKLAQGEYVAAEKVELDLAKNSLVSQIFIYGDSERSALVAIVVVKKDAFLSLLSSKGIKASSVEQANSEAKASELVAASLNETGRKEGLQGFEIPKAVFFTEEEFTVENDLLTPSLKPKRPQLKAHYKKQIDALYANLKD